ncbi:cupin domain-containing protein [Bradyrhizobium sp. KB893862 SZCCT0404]|uniref:cupin domain-containing protein n=1 Tax=Bradyrhizobium sp. KB893862 SZCCT0404 TaxID=2807672 RepID=UPI001BA66C43|nr:cupin domain-containing protein [Bradyrhizobium sp. KB893862 SZCCT0404]MBR1177012.1 cupin domain-containing protein [Bradyrhizobium sp. KB893862 SZCCT0404]
MSHRVAEKISRIVPPGEGIRYRLQQAGVHATIKLSPDDSPFTHLALVEYEIAQSATADLHAYKAIDRAYYCLEGTGTVVVGGKEYNIEAGSLVFCGRGWTVEFRNRFKGTMRLMAGSFPPGPEARHDNIAVDEGTGWVQRPLTAEVRRLLGIMVAPEAADFPVGLRGETFVMAPDEGESYWQASPTDGYVTAKVTPFNSSIYHYSMGTQLLEPGARVREHGHKQLDEVLIAVKGTGTIRVDGVEQPFPLGTVAVVGRYVLHCFANAGSDDFVVAGIANPIGIEGALRETGVPRVPGEARPKNIPRNAETGRLLIEKYGFIIPGGGG